MKVVFAVDDVDVVVDDEGCFFEVWVLAFVIFHTALLCVKRVVIQQWLLW